MAQVKRRDIRHLALELFAERLRAPRSEYADHPLAFFEGTGVVFCDEQKRLFEDIYFGRVQRAAVIAPRGGGKTLLGAALASAVYLFRQWDVVWCAASEAQALYGYEYISQFLQEPVVEDYTLEHLRTLARGRGLNWIRALPASPRSIRGVHGGGPRKGALLVVDEEAEMDPNVLRAALKTVNTANPGVILRMSTAHSATGTFIDLLDHAEERGYSVYSWDAFDVCRFDGETPDWDALLARFMPPPGRPDEAVARERLARAKADLEGYWNRKPRRKIAGWIPIEDIVQSYMEMPREWFDVEVMGGRAAGEGAVIDPTLIDKALVDSPPADPPDVAWVGIDWGFIGMTAVEVVGMYGDTLYVLESQDFSRTLFGPIRDYLADVKRRFGASMIYADSSHEFENAQLEAEGFQVTRVKFQTYKEAGVGRLRWLFETGRIRIPARCHTLIGQLRAWHRSADGRIVKRDDHHPDALVAATYAFESGLITHASLGIMPYYATGPFRSRIVPWVRETLRPIVYRGRTV
jgi:hypothetical protein